MPLRPSLPAFLLASISTAICQAYTPQETAPLPTPQIFDLWGNATQMSGLLR
jgi:hypothetical protein